MNQPIHEPINILSDPTRDEVSFNSNVDTRIDQKLKGVSVWIVTVVLSVVFGGIITSLWDLNGKVHTVVGQEAVRSEITDIRKQKIELLEDEITILNKKIENLLQDNDNYKDKVKTLETENKLITEKLNIAKGATK